MKAAGVIVDDAAVTPRHHLEEDVDDALGAVGGVGAWLTNTAARRSRGSSSARSSSQ
jgi:hypothetical protein